MGSRCGNAKGAASKRAMNLPEPVLQAYKKRFRDLRDTIGPSLHSVLDHFGELNDDLWLVLNRVVDWRERSAGLLLEPDRLIAAFLGSSNGCSKRRVPPVFCELLGDFWPDVLRLLELGEDTRGESHFRKILACFPKSTPAADRDTRELQLTDLDGTGNGSDFVNPLEELDEHYADCLYPAEPTLFKALRAIEDQRSVPDPDGL